MASNKKEIPSADGTWKLVVEASSVNLIFYNALIASARVYKKGQQTFWDRLFGREASWSSFSADSITVNGSLTSRFAPGVRGPIPGSPDSHTNSSSAECRAWAVFIGVKVTFRGGSGGPDIERSSYDMIADGVIANGSATVGTETLHPLYDVILTQIIP